MGSGAWILANTDAGIGLGVGADIGQHSLAGSRIYFDTLEVRPFDGFYHGMAECSIRGRHLEWDSGVRVALRHPAWHWHAGRPANPGPDPREKIYRRAGKIGGREQGRTGGRLGAGEMRGKGVTLTFMLDNTVDRSLFFVVATGRKLIGRG